jgi:hypothetical protein
MLTDAELARLSHASNQKYSKALMLKLTEELHNAIQRLAEIDSRRLRDELRYLIEIGVHYELERLKRQAQASDEIAAAVERRHNRDLRRALRNAARISKAA